MATTENMAESIKTALAEGNATSSTVATLQSLFGTTPARAKTAAPGPQAISSAREQRATSTKSSRTTASTRSAKLSGKGPKKVAFVPVLEDEAQPLSAKGRYALATDVVNISLKVLQTAAKSTRRSPCRRQDGINGHWAPRTSSSLSQRALQERSQNTSPAKPVQSTQSDGKSTETSTKTEAVSQAISWPATAECARLAFSQLRSADREQLGVRALPKFKLETGMLSLVGRLIALGLDNLAAKELYAVKKQLQSQTASDNVGKPPQPVNATRKVAHETLASLLRLEVDVQSQPDLAPLAMTYWSYVLHLLASSKRPATIEEALPYLDLDGPESAVSRIIAYTGSLKDGAKASKQLDALFQALMRFCPSVSTIADEAAKDIVYSIRPIVAFRIHTTALAVRMRMLKLQTQPVDGAKEVGEPFARAISALLRRLIIQEMDSDVLKLCQAACVSLDVLAEATTPSASNAAFSISRTMSILAERAGDSEKACEYAESAVRQCAGLEGNHARHVAGLARQLSSRCAIAASTGAIRPLLEDGLRELDHALQQSLSGSASDYETLLAELAHLVDRLKDGPHASIHTPLTRSAAAFASRYAEMNPGRQSDSIRDIISAALCVSRTSEELLSWVTKRTAQALVQAGSLRSIATRSASDSLMRTWSCSTSAAVLSRVLKGVVLKAAVSHPEKSVAALYDDDALAPEERGAALEWQLHAACEMVHKPKYKPSLGPVLQELLRRLLEVYTPSLFPARRLRVAAMVMRYCAADTEILSPPLLQALDSTDAIGERQLGHDEGLAPYLDDHRVSLAIARSFENNKLTTESLDKHLAVWHGLVGGLADDRTLHQVVEDPAALAQQLSSLRDYFGMLGDNKSQLQLACLLCQVQRLLDEKEQLCSSILCCARSYLLQGHAEKAAAALEEAKALLSAVGNTSLAALDYHITVAQYLLCIDRLDECSTALAAAADVRSSLGDDAVRSKEIKAYRLQHVRGWLVQSQYLSASGSARQALYAAKRSVKIANSIWASLEKAAADAGISLTDRLSEQEGRPVDMLTRGLSKLNLRPDDKQNGTCSPSPPGNGAAFWAVVPVMCQALMNLSDVFAHHGVFVEANYSSQQAVKIAEGVRSHELLSRVRYHRSILLASAGKVEEAELCLAHEQDVERLLSPLTKVQQLRAKAAVSKKMNDAEDALAFLRKAEGIVKEIQSESYIASLERPCGVHTSAAVVDAPKQATAAQKKPVTTKRAAAPAKAVKTPRDTVARGKKKAVTPSVPKENTAWGSCYALQKLEAHIMLQSTILAAKLGRSDAQSFAWLAEYCQIFPDTFGRRMFNYMASMQKAEAAIGADFTFNALAESTLAFPALQSAERRLSVVQSTLQPAREKTAKGSRVAKSKKPPGESLLELLLTARQCLERSDSASSPLTTRDTHKLHALLTDTSMLLSATSTARAPEVLHPVREALNVEQPRIHAAECLSVAAKLECEISKASDLLIWPQLEDSQPVPQLTALKFQDEYVNILPGPWTAVSLSLNEQCDELYVARYRKNQTPLILRLPFSRQKSEDDGDLFDFQVGRAELDEIIDLSNYSCHNSVDTSVKGAKTNWWSEREALDRRLQELLINIENIWLGGFRGILSQHDRVATQLDQFRKSFDSILDRHLPSRQIRGSKKIALDEQILELFIGLGTDSDGKIDLDEPLADLLYFVVDMLQFSGERNAYDEVDFDSMTVEISDALRTYYDAAGEQNGAAHLILVLDRRLQAFPWENLPCLEKASVSRVDSMLTLRERIVAMRSPAHEHHEEGIHTVSRHSGAYILNPSGDLTSTETILTPELSKLTYADGSPWTSVVKRAPTEEVFKAALQTSSNLLYFGHGAGSQYIRPRTIRKLDACSEVVWLMGCSSGAVTEYDELEPSSVALAYLQAGQLSSANPSKCMAVLATLWDVTDKDIDRFSLAVGQEWGLWNTPSEASKLPAKTPRKRTVAAAAATPEKCAKTPKTPKVHKTPAPARTPARNRSRVRVQDGKKQSLVEAVARSRDACFLRYLNGAAPVVYGVPVYLGE